MNNIPQTNEGEKRNMSSIINYVKQFKIIIFFNEFPYLNQISNY